MALEHLIEGIDPTGDPCVSVSTLLQMIRAAKPVEDEGWLHFSDTAPDVVANPEMVWFLWVETVGGVVPASNPNIYYYNGTAWTKLPFEILDGSITLAKLSGTGASAYDIIQRNALNTAFVFSSIANAIQNGTIPPAKLLVPGAIDSYVLTSILGTPAFITYAAFLSSIAAGSLPLTKLATAGANTFLRMNVGGTAWEARTSDISDQLAQGYVAGQSIRRNAGNTGWEGFTPASSSPFTLASTPSLDALPTLPTFVLTVPHGLGAVPKLVYVTFVNTNAEYGYIAGDEIPITSIISHNASNDDTPIAVQTDGTNVKVIFVNDVTYDYRVVRKDTGLIDPITPANWKVRVRAYA